MYFQLHAVKYRNYVRGKVLNCQFTHSFITIVNCRNEASRQTGRMEKKANYLYIAV